MDGWTTIPCLIGYKHYVSSSSSQLLKLNSFRSHNVDMLSLSPSLSEGRAVKLTDLAVHFGLQALTFSTVGPRYYVTRHLTDYGMGTSRDRHGMHVDHKVSLQGCGSDRSVIQTDMVSMLITKPVFWVVIQTGL